MKIFHLFSVIWAVFFPLVVSAEEVDLSLYEKSIYSQNGEDGIISRLVQIVNPKDRFCIEFGAFDGFTGSNTYWLRRQGWKSLLLDRGYELPEFSLYREYLTVYNLNEIFAKYGVSEVSLMSIDVDYNDFHIWQALDSRYDAEIVVIEYNASIPPDKDYVVKYRPYYLGDGTDYFGASILAMYRLGCAKGYSLVYAENTGTNLFFLRNDVVERLEKDKGISFKNINNVEKLYRRPTYGKGVSGSHPADPHGRTYTSSDEFLKGR